MKEGLLWFDNDPKHKLIDKVNRAASCYRTKLQRKPTVCYINTDEFDGEINEVNGIHLKPAVNIQPHYYWIGVEQDPVSAKAA